MNILINGENKQQLDVLDRATQYGDGLFETIALINGKFLLWNLHIQRLKKSAYRLGLPLPKIDLLFNEAEQLKNQTNQKKAVLKIIISRGQGGRGYAVPNPPNVTRILSLHPYPNYPQEWRTKGIQAEISPIQLGLNPLLAGMKHLNRLEQVLARSDWHNPHIAEKVMLDINQNVIEGTQSNLFIITNQQLYTPLLNNSGVEGVMKQYVVQQMTELGIHCTEKNLKINDLIHADGLFFTNSVMGYWVVKQFENKHYLATPLLDDLFRTIDPLFF